MPSLPDLRAKLKVDLSEADAAVAKAAILGQALQRELGGTRGAEIDNSMKRLGTSIEDAGRKMDNAGTAFIKWGDAGQVASLRISSSTARTKGDFDQLEQRTRALGNSLDNEFKKGTSAVIRLSDDGGAALGNVSRQMSATGVAGTQASGGLISMGTAGLVLIGVGIALAAALAPVVVALGAFVVGVLAVASVMAVGVAAVGALAAGIVILAAATQGWTGVTQTVPQAQAAVANATNAHTAAVLALHQQETAYNSTTTHTAQQTLALQVARQKVTDTTAKLTKAQQDLTAAETGAVNPLQKLKDDAEAMANTLGQQAAPMAALLLGWLDKLIPSVQTLGQSLLTWFGDRLPGILDGASAVSKVLTDRLSDLGTVLGHFLDQAGARSPQLTAFFDLMLRVGIGAVDGLLQNLLRLSDWFLERLPKFQPFISSVFGALGSTVQAIGGALGRLADWVITNWPAIISTIGSLWSNIQQGWRIVQPVLDGFKQAWIELLPYFQYIRDHAEVLKPVLIGLGVVIGAIVVVMAAVGVAIVLLVAGLVWLGTKIAEAVAQWIQAGKDIGDTMSRVGVIARQYQADIGAVFSAVGTFIHTAVVQYQQMATDVGTTFSNIGTILRGYQSTIGNVFSAVGSFFRTAVSEYQQAGRDIGGVFSAIGTGARGMADTVGSIFGGLKDKVWSGLQSVAGVFNNFAGAVTGALKGFGITIPAFHFAQGGVIPGYAPGIDSVPAMLSPGEGILTPQTTRNMGGAAGIEALNRSQGMGGLGASLGAASAAIGAWGGQCVEFLQRLLGLSFHGNANQWVNAPYAHTQTAAPGELAVFTGGPYGHLAMVTNPLDGYNFQVLDSNWVGPEIIGSHVMNKGMYGFSTFLQPGTPGLPGILGSIAGAIPLGQILKGLIEPLAAAAHAAVSGIPASWARPLANSLIDKIVANVSGRAGGGPVVAGQPYLVGENGPELFAPDVAGHIFAAGGLGGGRSSPTLDLLRHANDMLEQIYGHLVRDLTGSGAVALLGRIADSLDRLGASLTVQLGGGSSRAAAAIAPTAAATPAALYDASIDPGAPFHALWTKVNPTLADVAQLAGMVAAGQLAREALYDPASPAAKLGLVSPDPNGYVIGRARGGPVVPGHLYTVGERGPELFSTDVPGHITPHGAGASMATVEGLLGQVVGLLGEINGTPQLSRRDASRRYAT